MEYSNKTKAQLIDEINAMRKKIGELESKIDALKKRLPENIPPAERSEKRKNIRTHVEFIADFDIVEARGINISEGGICFALDEDLPFEMRFELDGKLHQHRAHLVWLKRLPEGGYNFGFMFVRPVQNNIF